MKTIAPMKERELRAMTTCAACGRKIGQTEFPAFWKLTIERHGLDLRAISRQNSFAGMLNGHAGLAMAMGPDEDMTIPLMDEPVSVMICEGCGTDQVMVAMLAEKGAADE